MQRTATGTTDKIIRCGGTSEIPNLKLRFGMNLSYRLLPFPSRLCPGEEITYRRVRPLRRESYPTAAGEALPVVVNGGPYGWMLISRRKEKPPRNVRSKVVPAGPQNSLAGALRTQRGNLDLRGFRPAPDGRTPECPPLPAVATDGNGEPGRSLSPLHERPYAELRRVRVWL